MADIINDHTFSSLKTTTVIISQFLWVRNLGTVWLNWFLGSRSHRTKSKVSAAEFLSGGSREGSTLNSFRLLTEVSSLQ